MSAIILTGAGGFLGRHVADALLHRGYEVHGVQRSPEPGDADKRIRWHQADLLDRSATRAVLNEVAAEGLVHLAWTSRHGEYWTTPANLDWVAASLHLFRDFADKGGRRIVVAGSSAEYDWHSAGPFSEDSSPARPASLYGHSKNSLRQVLAAWAGPAGISWAWGRIFNLYGPFEPPERLVPRVIRQLIAGKELEFDDGNTSSDFLHVSDAAEAFAAVYASGLQGMANICSGTPVRTREMVEAIAARLGASDRIRFGALPAPQDAPARVEGSAHRIRSALGWAPMLDLESGVSNACEWWLAQASE